MNGYVNNQNNTLIGIAKDEDECGRMVNQQVPLASGATYAKHNKTCWAGTSESIHLSSGFRACLLNGLCNCSLPKYKVQFMIFVIANMLLYFSIKAARVLQ